MADILWFLVYNSMVDSIVNMGYSVFFFKKTTLKLRGAILYGFTHQQGETPRYVAKYLP